jgi:hypothetical protein
MKRLVVLMLFLCAPVLSNAQTNLRTVMVATNGVTQKPTNFWTANSNSINAVVAASSTSFTPSDSVYRIQQYFFGNNTKESNNSTITDINSNLSIGIAATNTNAIGAVRLIGDVNSSGTSGVGTLFANDSHTTWIRLEALPRENGLIRFVLGLQNNLSTNLASYPTNRAIGLELRSLSGSLTNEVRLIAHNGTTNTNGPWVTVGNVFQDYTLGVSQNKTNGQIRLFVGVNQGTPTLNTNATILGGPTNNGININSALEVGVFTTNTNSGSVNLRVDASLVEIAD